MKKALFLSFLLPFFLGCATPLLTQQAKAADSRQVNNSDIAAIEKLLAHVEALNKIEELKKRGLLTDAESKALSASADCAATDNPVHNTALPSAGAGGALAGNWEGTLKLKHAPFEELRLRFTLVDSEIKIFHFNSVNGLWSEAMPGQFQISYNQGNAVIHGTHNGPEGDEKWVETWVLAVTALSKDSARVEWLRLVNNVNLPVSKTGRTFSEGAEGILTRLTER